MGLLDEVMNQSAVRRVIGVQGDYGYIFSDRKPVFEPFHTNGDIVQSTY